MAPSVALILQISRSVVSSEPGLSLLKATFLPSGDQVGEVSSTGFLERLTGLLRRPWGAAFIL